MRSIEARFNQIADDQPNLSSLMCLCGAVRGQGFGRLAIQKAFVKLVDKGDYEKEDKMTLLKHLYNLSGVKLTGRGHTFSAMKLTRSASKGVRTSA